jgi:hypothetical protein
LPDGIFAYQKIPNYCSTWKAWEWKCWYTYLFYGHLEILRSLVM